MANVTIKVPPPEGTLSLHVGDELTIDAAKDCTFCCSIGGNFSPDLTSVELAKGNNGPYTAETAGTGSYNTSDKGRPCTPESPTTNAKSIQISG